MHSLLVRGGFHLVLLFGISLNAYATPAGGAYAGLVTKGDWKHLQDFYDTYYTRELGLIKEFENELALFRQYNIELNDSLKQNEAGDDGCEVDCATLAGMNRQMAEINRLLARVRGQVIANATLLQANIQSATAANAAYTDAQAIRELRKLGFDMTKIVADTFNFDFGPLAAQLARNLSAEGAAGPAKHATTMASRTLQLNQLGRFYPKKEGLTRLNFKRALSTAAVEELANKLIPAKDADMETAKSFTTKFTSGVWLKLNELAAEQKPMTKGALTTIAIQATLGAYADRVGRQLRDDVERAKKDTKTSESRRLMTIAEWKAMMHLRRLLDGNSRERGVAGKLNWETGHLLHLSGKRCNAVRKKMPRTPPAEDIRAQTLEDAGPALERAVSMLQQINTVREKQCNQTEGAKQRENIVGYWRACNGRIVRFVRQGARIVGYYTSLGNLGQFGFQPNEESHRLSQAAPGRYTGQIKWRWTDGKMEWRSTTVTIDGDALKDSGADQCGRRMTRHKSVTGP